MLFPVPPVEIGRQNAAKILCVQAAEIDTVTIGMRARNVERLHAAYRTKEMRRRTGVEFVRGQFGLALEELEAGLRHNEMPVAGHVADRAIAIEQLDLIRCLHLELHRATVAPALFPGY